MLSPSPLFIIYLQPSLPVKFSMASKTGSATWQKTFGNLIADNNHPAVCKLFLMRKHQNLSKASGLSQTKTDISCSGATHWLFLLTKLTWVTLRPQMPFVCQRAIKSPCSSSHHDGDQKDHKEIQYRANNSTSITGK